MRNETADADKIAELLARAERQSAAATPETSSIVAARRVFPGAAAASEAFGRLHAKLLRVAAWNPESEISTFALFDGAGAAVPEKTAAVGDFIRITLPGSGKNDWVEINEITASAAEVVLTVRPSRDPTDAAHPNATAHFFTADSSNNFCLQRAGATVNFFVIGLDERANTTETAGILETVRNYATAHLGCFFGIQKTQWQTFCDNFLD